MRNPPEIEAYFKRKIDLLGDLAEPIEVEMIFNLFDHMKKLESDIDRLTALNKHYCYKFYNGDIEAMKKDCSYLF